MYILRYATLTFFENKKLLYNTKKSFGPTIKKKKLYISIFGNFSKILAVRVFKRVELFGYKNVKIVRFYSEKP